jgi:regulator of replication initiation timing
MEERKKAYAKRDAMLAVLKNATADAKAEKRAKVLADAAIAGKNITRMKIKKSAANKDAACDDAFAGMPSVNTSHAFCNATEAAPSGRRRGLLQVAEYDITIEVNPEEVNVTAAVTELQTVGGITDITTTTVDPLVELSSVEGVATSDLTALETEVVAAAAVQAEVVAIEAQVDTTAGEVADIETEVEAFETEAASLEAEADVLGAEVQEAAAEAAYAESVAEEEDRKAKDAADAVAALPPRSDDGADVDIVYVTKPKGGAAGLAGLFTAIVAAAAAFV